MVTKASMRTITVKDLRDMLSASDDITIKGALDDLPVKFATGYGSEFLELLSIYNAKEDGKDIICIDIG